MITVFTTNTCAYCVMVKKFLSMRGKKFEVINLDDNPAVRQSLFEKTGAMTVPQTLINDKYIIGWNPGALASALTALNWTQ